MTKQGYTRDYIEEVITSDALNEQYEQKDPNDKHQEELDKDIKAAQDAAKAAGDAAKNVLGNMVGMGGSFLGKTVQKAVNTSGPKPQAQQAGPQKGPPSTAPQQQPKGPTSEEPGKIIEEDEEEYNEQHKPNFVKHLNKTRTMSAKQKWEWAFDRILTVMNLFF